MFKLFKKILEIFFPNHCLACDKIINKEALFCSSCWPKLQFITDPKCRICSHPFESAAEGKHFNMTCGECLRHQPAFDKVITIFCYNDLVKKIIADFKYRDQTFIAQKIGKLLFEKVKSELVDIDFITIVPLHLSKLRKRKFNQALLLANQIAKLSGKLKVYNDFLLRTKNTATQASLSQKQRHSNTKYAFTLNEKYRELIKDKKILLIDDVMTTGATVEACAKILKKYRAKKIVVLTLAKTTLKHS